MCIHGVKEREDDWDEIQKKIVFSQLLYHLKIITLYSQCVVVMATPLWHVNVSLSCLYRQLNSFFV
jgi:hypothetical protein